MTNKEFYFDKLLAALIIVSSCRSMYYYVFGKNCTGKNCKDCEFSNMESTENWLNAEHEEPEPPLLENGDDLSPGDWIMVRDNEDAVWENWQFLTYLDGWFYARKIVPDGWIEKVDRFRQARLPLEGE